MVKNEQRFKLLWQWILGAKRNPYFLLFCYFQCIDLKLILSSMNLHLPPGVALVNRVWRRRLPLTFCLPPSSGGCEHVNWHRVVVGAGRSVIGQLLPILGRDWLPGRGWHRSRSGTLTGCPEGDHNSWLLAAGDTKYSVPTNYYNIFCVSMLNENFSKVIFSTWWFIISFFLNGGAGVTDPEWQTSVLQIIIYKINCVDICHFASVTEAH